MSRGISDDDSDAPLAKMIKKRRATAPARQDIESELDVFPHLKTQTVQVDPGEGDGSA